MQAMTTNTKPAVTTEMQLKNLEWAFHDERWVPVCRTCKGNCGQCGQTDLIGSAVPASMDALAESLLGAKCR